MDAGMRADLDDLRFHWGQVYVISVSEGSGVWSARYEGRAELLTGRTCDELRLAIRADYQQRRRAEQQALARLRERSST